MSKKLFVGSLDWATTEADLVELFSKYGDVEEAIIIKEKPMYEDSKPRSKGFGFVTMANEDEAANAIEMLNGVQLGKRNIAVTEARPQEERPRRAFGDRGPRPSYGDRR